MSNIIELVSRNQLSSGQSQPGSLSTTDGDTEIWRTLDAYYLAPALVVSTRFRACFGLRESFPLYEISIMPSVANEAKAARLVQ